MSSLRSIVRLACIPFLCGVLPAASSYVLVDLGPGGATSINGSGRIVGNSAAGAWTHDGTNRTPLVLTMRPLGGPPEVQFTLTVSQANAISDSGQIVGSQSFGAPGQETLNALSHPGSGVATLLAQGRVAYGVNASGTVVGLPFIFDGTTETALPGSAPILFAVNAGGIAVGTLNTGITTVPARFAGGEWSVLDLTGLPQVGLFPWTGEARGINASGAIVGSVYLARQRPLDPRYAFLHANGVSTMLEGLGGLQTMANAINDSGIVVGTGEDPTRAWHAFVHEGGVAMDLNGKLSGGGEGWVLTSATSINASGAIVGTGVKDGEARAFLLVPSGADLPPTVLRQPTDVSVFAGEPFELVALGSGSGTLSYQWQRSGTNLPSAQAASHAVARSILDDAGEYRVVISNGAGSVTSAVARVDIKVRPELSLEQYAGVSVRGLVGKSYRIEGADAPGADWVVLKHLTLEVSPTLWIDETSPARTRRVYRVVEGP